VHYADAIGCNARRPPQGALPLLTRQTVTEAMLYYTQHHILHGFTVISSGTGRSVQCLAIATVQRKRDPQFSPLSQLNSKPSEHHRWLLSPTATFLLCAHFEDGIASLRLSKGADAQRNENSR